MTHGAHETYEARGGSRVGRAPHRGDPSGGAAETTETETTETETTNIPTPTTPQATAPRDEINRSEHTKHPHSDIAILYDLVMYRNRTLIKPHFMGAMGLPLCQIQALIISKC